MKSGRPPITVKELLKIFAGSEVFKRQHDRDLALGRKAELPLLAAILTGLQYCDFLPEEEFKGFPAHVTDVLGNEHTIKAPLLPDPPPFDWDARSRYDDVSGKLVQSAFGHPRRFEKKWHDDDIKLRIRDEFHKAMGRKFSDKHATARFLFVMIPRITGERPSLDTIASELVQPRLRKRRPRLLR
jgi:hypothetical protein